MYREEYRVDIFETSRANPLITCLIIEEYIADPVWTNLSLGCSRKSGFFSKCFGGHMRVSPILGPPVPLFLVSGDVSAGLWNQSGMPYSTLLETNVMYIHSPRSTFGATSTDLCDGQLATSLVAHILLPAEARLPGLETMTWVLASE